MDNITRLHYLEVMGIDSWIPRAESDLALIPKREVGDKSVDFPVVDEWSVLQDKVAGCTQCSLCEMRTQTVFGSGNRQAEWMLVGEEPGGNEDAVGEPFLGQAGDLLTEMIRAIGLERNDVYLTHIIKCKTPDNRAPKADELKSCYTYLQRQIQLLNPKIILAVGRVAAQSLLKTNKSLADLRGVIHQVEGVPLVVVYHPAYLLRSLHEKKKAWQDLQLAIKQIKK
jgi:DNA polymerase